MNYITPLPPQFVQGIRLGYTLCQATHRASRLSSWPILRIIETDGIRAIITLKLASLALEGTRFSLPRRLKQVYCILPIALGVIAGISKFQLNGNTWTAPGQFGNWICLKQSGLNKVILAVAFLCLAAQRRSALCAGLLLSAPVYLVIEKVHNYINTYHWINKHARKIDLSIFAVVSLGLLQAGFIQSKDVISHLIGDDYQNTFRYFLFPVHFPTLLLSPVQASLFECTDTFTARVQVVNRLFQTLIYRIMNELELPWSASFSKKLLIGLSLVEQTEALQWLSIDWGSPDRNGQTILHEICQHTLIPRYMVRSMLKFVFSVTEIDVNHRDNMGLTALHYACWVGALGTVEELIELPWIKVDLLTDGKEKATALEIACARGKPVIAALLLENEADPNKSNSNTPRSLIWAIGKRFPFNLIDGLITRMTLTEDQRRLWKIHACCFLDLDLEHLCLQPSDVSATTYKGLTAFHWAVRGNALKALEKIFLINPDAINLQDSKGNTPLHLACEGHVEAARVLLHLKANPNIEDSHGFSPVYAALNGKNRYKAFLELLHASEAIDRNAPGYQKSFQQWRFFQCVRKNSLDSFPFAENPYVDINLPFNGSPPLEHAIKKGQYRNVLCLLEQEGIALEYHPQSGTSLDLLSACGSKSQSVHRWMNEVVFKLSPEAVDRLAEKIHQFSDDDFKSLYLQNPLLIALALKAPKARKKVIENLFYICIPNDQIFAMEDRHDPFIWVTSMLEHLNEVDSVIQNASPTVALAILPYLSRVTRKQLGATFKQYLSDVCKRHSEALGKELPKLKTAIANKTLTPREWSAIKGTLLADQRHLQSLEQIFVEMRMDKSIWKEADEALRAYNEEIQKLHPQFAQEAFDVEQEALREDIGSLLTKLVDQNKISVKEIEIQLGFEMRCFFEVGLHSSKDCQLIGIDLVPLFTLRAIRSEILPENQIKIILPALNLGVGRLEELADHLNDSEMSEVAIRQKNELDKLISVETPIPSIVSKLIAIEAERILIILKRYITQTNRVPVKDDASLSECYPESSDRDWKSFWKVEGTSTTLGTAGTD